MLWTQAFENWLNYTIYVCDFIYQFIEAAKVPPLDPLTFFLRVFLHWQVVTGMEAEQIKESLANYIWFLRVANAVCISHLLLIDRRTPVDLWHRKCAFLITFNLNK